MPTTVRPVLKRLHSPDVHDLHSYSPPDPGCFCVLLQAMFGPEGSEGEESFDILVCTPTWLSAEVEREGPIIGRHYLIVGTFDLRQIRSVLERFAGRCVSQTWDEAAVKLSRLGHWEFEDYQPWP